MLDRRAKIENVGTELLETLPLGKERQVVPTGELERPILVGMPLPQALAHVPEPVPAKDDHMLGVEGFNDDDGVGVALAPQVDEVLIHPGTGRIGEVADLNPLIASDHVVPALHPARRERSVKEGRDQALTQFSQRIAVRGRQSRTSRKAARARR